MNKLRELVNKDRLGEVISKVEGGQVVDLKQLTSLQLLDFAMIGRYRLIDALDDEEKADKACEDALQALKK